MSTTSGRTDPSAGDPECQPEHHPPVAPEDERIGWGTAGFYGLQHILAMYAGVVSPPIIIGSAAGLTGPEQAVLVTAALFVSGLGTLLQALGVPYVGSRLPLVQGVSFAACCSG